jgi:hypothetical protein
VKESEAVPVVPAALVSLATIVWAPSARPLGVNDQAPLASAVAVPVIAVPSTAKCTTAPASAVPRSVESEVIRSVDEAPVSFDSPAVTTGGGVGSTTVGSTT